MKSSCIEHPKSESLVVIRKWQAVACDGNPVAAALMSFFEYWHNIKLEMIVKNKAINDMTEATQGDRVLSETLLQFHTEQDLINGIMNIARRDAIRKALDILTSKGFISIHSNPSPRYKFDKTRYFLFHDDAVNNWLKDYKADTESGSGEIDLLSYAKRKEIVDGDDTTSINQSSMSINRRRSSKNRQASSINQLPQSENRRTITEITSKTSSQDYIHRQQHDAAAAAAKKNNLLEGENFGLSQEHLEEREQALKQDEETHQPNRTSKPTIDNSSNVANSQKDISPSNMTTHEDKSCGAARREVITTTDKLLSVALLNAGIKENKQIQRLAKEYSLEQVCGAIAHLENYENTQDKIVENLEGYLTEALKGDWVDEMVERGEIPQERKREWLTGHTARLLGLCGGFSIMDNSLAIETDDGDRIIDLTKLTDFVATEGWGAFIKKVEESRECLRTA